MTPAEQHPEGTILIKQVRSNLLELGRGLLSELIEEMTGLHPDVSTKSGERVIIFSLSEKVERRFEMNLQATK